MSRTRAGTVLLCTLAALLAPAPAGAAAAPVADPGPAPGSSLAPAPGRDPGAPSLVYSVVEPAEEVSDLQTRLSAVRRLSPPTGRQVSLVAASGPRSLRAQSWSTRRGRVFYSITSASAPAPAPAVDSVPQGGGAARRELTRATEADVALAGDRVVFTRQVGGVDQVFVTQPGGGARRLTGAGGEEPRLSPDGRRVVFSRYVTAGAEPQVDLFTIGVDGTRLRRITYASTSDRQGVFSPDGRRLLFSRAGAGPRSVFSVGADGRGLRLVRANASDPDWAGNGYLAYIAYPSRAAALAFRDGQVAVRSPGLPGRETVLTRDRNVVTAVRFAR